MGCRSQGNEIASLTVPADRVGLMVISTDSEVTGEIVIAVSDSILVRINDLSEFSHLRDQHMTGANQFYSHRVV